MLTSLRNRTAQSHHAIIFLTLILAALVLTLSWDGAAAEDSLRLVSIESDDREAASRR